MANLKKYQKYDTQMNKTEMDNGAPDNDLKGKRHTSNIDLESSKITPKQYNLYNTSTQAYKLTHANALYT